LSFKRGKRTGAIPTPRINLPHHRARRESSQLTGKGSRMLKIDGKSLVIGFMLAAGVAVLMGQSAPVAAPAATPPARFQIATHGDNGLYVLDNTTNKVASIYQANKPGTKEFPWVVISSFSLTEAIDNKEGANPTSVQR
jgi:hypothetical protein